ILPCDSPLIHPMFFEIMWSMVEDHHAAVPRWPNGWIEPLHSVFLTDVAAEVAEQCLKDSLHQMSCLVSRIGRVIYLSTQALKSFDEKLHTFVNINTPGDLRKLERLLRHPRSKH
ncbi:MAG: molybdenum cofactor guanylyltransferase, partial [Promethearchaeota archaeon]